MVRLLVSLLLLSATQSASAEPTGYIRGVVVDGTRGSESLENIAVVLRAGPHGGLTQVAETRTDHYGKFAFPAVPLDPSITYLPGAQRDGVYYPARRVRLSPDEPLAHQRIVTFAAVESPSPLRAVRHQIDVLVGEEVLEVSETLLIENPTRKTFVGATTADESRTTLRLSVPPSFDRVTFASEFHGRRFRVVEHRPTTDIPWPPGQRELKFAYRVPLENAAAVLRRELDLPSRDLKILVRGRNPSEVRCNLRVDTEDNNEVVFASPIDELPVGHVIELRVGVMPVPWLRYARSGSVAALAALTLATVLILRRREKHENTAPPHAFSGGGNAAPKSTSSSPRENAKRSN